MPARSEPSPQAHVAILQEPYLRLIARGRKTIECRLTRTPKPPFRAIAAGDVVLLKRSGGTIEMVASVLQARFVVLEEDRQLDAIRNVYGSEIGADDAYWQQRAGATFLSLVWLTDVRTIEPLRFRRPGREAWHLLDRTEYASLARRIRVTNELIPTASDASRRSG